MNDPGHFTFIFESELARINRELVRRPSIETGGDLFGFWLHDGSPIVYCALGPGPNARHESTAFYQDVDWLTDEGRRLNDAFGLQHVGEWHSHHQMNLDHPSGGDVSTIRQAMSNHRFERFALVICNVEMQWSDFDFGSGARADDEEELAGGVRSVALNAYLFDSTQRRRYHAMPWVVLPRQSPLSSAAEDTSPMCDTVLLRPRVVSLGELRGASARTQPIAALGPNWFAEPHNQARLQEEMKRFEALGLNAKMVLSKDNRLGIKASAHDGVMHYRLFDGFPKRAPEAVFIDDCGREQAVEVSWDGGWFLADLHADVLAAMDGE